MRIRKNQFYTKKNLHTYHIDLRWSSDALSVINVRPWGTHESFCCLKHCLLHFLLVLLFVDDSMLVLFPQADNLYHIRSFSVQDSVERVQVLCFHLVVILVVSSILQDSLICEGTVGQSEQSVRVESDRPLLIVDIAADKFVFRIMIYAVNILESFPSSIQIS